MYSPEAPGPPRIERLHVRNFRALRDVLLGDLWMEGHLGAGDPLVNQGAPLVADS